MRSDQLLTYSILSFTSDFLIRYLLSFLSSHRTSTVFRHCQHFKYQEKKEKIFVTASAEIIFCNEKNLVLQKHQMIPQKQFSLYADFNFPSSSSLLFFSTVKAPPQPLNTERKSKRRGWGFLWEREEERRPQRHCSPKPLFCLIFMFF